MFEDGVNNYGRTKWYVVQTRSNFEKRVSVELENKGIEQYYPAFRETHQWADRKKLIERPVFGGYVFIRMVDSSENRLQVLKVNGTVRILGTSEGLDSVPDEEVNAIRQVMSSGSLVSHHPFLRQGALVRIRRGALKDVEGVLVKVKNEARIVVSISLLSQSIAAEVDLQDVEVIRQQDKTASLVA